jgi:chromosome segregation ATPase
MPHTPDANDLNEQKRRFVDSLDAARSAPVSIPLKFPAISLPETLPVSELETLRNELSESKATCRMLEEEVRKLEQKALEAIAEAGALRRCLDEQGISHLSSQAREAEEQGCNVAEKLYQAESSKDLLTNALSASETEIHRLTKALDLLVRKFPAA